MIGSGHPASRNSYLPRKFVPVRTSAILPFPRNCLVPVYVKGPELARGFETIPSCCYSLFMNRKRIKDVALWSLIAVAIVMVLLMF